MNPTNLSVCILKINFKWIDENFYDDFKDEIKSDLNLAIRLTV